MADKPKKLSEINTEIDPMPLADAELDKQLGPEGVERERAEVERLRALIEKTRADKPNKTAADVDPTQDPPARTREELEAMMSPEALERDRERNERLRALIEKIKTDRSKKSLLDINTEEDPMPISDEELNAAMGAEGRE